MRSSIVALAFVALSLSGCYSSHARPIDAGPMPDAPGCDPASRPSCTRRSGPCDPLVLVDSECVSLAWQCPSDAQPYASPWTSGDTCLPLRGAPLFADGVHESPVPVPIDGHCEWIFPFSDGTSVQLLGVESATSCDALPAPTEPIDTPHDPSMYVNVQAAIATPSGTRVLSRAWAFDATSYGGVHSLGVELGRVAGDRLSFDGTFVFGGTVDLGDAALVDGDFVYAYGQPGTGDGFEQDVVVGRAPVDQIDDTAAWTLFGSGGWGVGDPVRMFGSGPHRSAVIADPRGSGFVHVYAAGFGNELRIHTAPRPEGPWTSSALLAPCELPASDPGAYCAGPQVHRELLDPMQPSVLIVSYSIGSTSADQDVRRAADPDGYWPHIVRVTMP